MNRRSEILVGLTTLIRKEIKRFLRIWVQTLVPPAVTMSLYFVIFWVIDRSPNRLYGWLRLHTIYDTWAYHDVGHHKFIF